MASDFHQRIKRLFLDALNQPAEGRDAWLSAQAADDPAVLAEVRALLSHHHGEPLVQAVEPTPRPQIRIPAAEQPQVAIAELVNTQLSADPLGLVGVTIDDRYEVEELVAEGGFGYVYRARHTRWDRPVAVKVFKQAIREHDPLKRAFIKEGALLNDLSRRTTAIVQSLDVGTWVNAQGLPRLFTVLEWLEGQTLAAALKADRLPDGHRRPWPLDEILTRLADVAEALAVAHANGIAHRDVKPGNIYLLDEPSGAVKLLDFGVAKVASERMGGFESTAGEMTAFTVRYAAPEQITRKFGATGPWTDVYALATLYTELLAGQHPLEGATMFEAMSRIQFDASRPTPEALGVELPPEQAKAFERALAVNPQDRPQDAATFHALLAGA